MSQRRIVRCVMQVVLVGLGLSVGGAWGGEPTLIDPGGGRTRHEPPRGEPELRLYLEPLSPFTTVRHEVAAALRVPRMGTVRLTVISSVPVADLVWSGAQKVSGAARMSMAEVEGRRPGTVAVTVTPWVRREDGRLEALPERSKSVVVTVTNDNLRRVEVRLKGADTALVRHARQAVVLEAETRPAGYEGLIEWTGGETPATGTGPVFTTSYGVKGRYMVRAGIAATRAVEVYALAGVRWESLAGRTVWYGYPIRFEATTDPAGYEQEVPWRVEAMHDMMTHAAPDTGKGPAFTTTFSPTMDGTTFWAQVYAAETPVLAAPDQPPPVCNPSTCDDGDACTSDTCMVGICMHAPYPGLGCPGLPGTGYDEESPAAVEVPCVTAALQPFEGNLAPNPDGCNPVGYACSLPIGLSNGEVKLRVVDLEVPSRGFPFVWARSYSSRMNVSGPAGFNWEMTYQRRILPAGGGTLSVINGVGREDLYPFSGGNQYQSPAAIYDAVMKNGDTSYTQTDPEGMRFDYDTSGYLVGMTDRNGNTLTIARNGFHNVTLVTDTQGRQYSVAYTDGTANQKVASLTDFAGRQVVYTYDGNGDLIRVRGPVVTGTPNVNDFPSGKTTLYTYTSGFANQKQNHNLTSIVDPAYNVGDNPALSKAKVTLTYAPTTDPLQEEFDQVVSERWGHDQGGPPGNPGVVVGGTKTFVYTRSLGGDPDAPAGAALRTTVTDANGNVQVHYFNSARLEIKRIERTNRNVRPGEPDDATTYAYTPEGLLATRTEPRGNGVSYLYDSTNPRRGSQKNLLEQRRRTNGIAGGGVDLVTRYTYEPVFNELRTVTDPRGFPSGDVPLNFVGQLSLGDAQVARYTTTRLFDYQETISVTQSEIDTSHRIPEGLGDLNGAADFNEGNVVKIAFPPIQTAGPNLGQAASATFSYNDRGQMLLSTDPEGHVTRRVYFAASGAPNDPNDREGYLQSVTRDFGGLNLNLTTQYEYDTAGNVTKVTDPKGQDTQYTVNALNQVVQVLSRFAFGSTRYRTDVFYDANDNVTEKRRQNFDENGVLYAHNPLVETAEYDILGNRVATVRDRSLNDNSVTGTVRTEWLYDANLNVKAVRQPLAVSGAVPANVVTMLYDERDLVFKVTTGDNDTDPANAPPLGASVVTTNHDGNRNPVETIDRIRNAQHAFAPTTAFPGSAVGDVTKRGYDGFDREVKTVDREGNEATAVYDLASNVVQTALRGPVDHTAGTLSLLAQSDVTWDERNREVQEDARHVTTTGTVIGDGHRVTQFKYDRDDKTLEVTDDRGLKTTTQWDAADRRFKVIDALANETEYGYDLNDNVTTVTHRDVSTDLGSPLQTFVTMRTYDGVDRLVKTMDPAGDVEDLFYDARDNVVKVSDGVRGTLQPGGPGNIVRRVFDGLDRLVQTERVLTTNGRGDTGQATVITTRQMWDDDSRLVSQTDDNNHTTAYTYDEQNRPTAITYADALLKTTAYDTDNQVTGWTDPNGTIATLIHDGLGRLLGRSVAPASGVLGATSETFGYDGAGRVTLAQSTDGVTPVNRSFEYDSLSRRTKEQQGTESVDSIFDAVGNRTQVTYPGQFGGGRRVLTLGYDNLNRLRSVADAAAIATLHYKGPERLERRTYGVDASPISRLDVAYDSLPRPIDLNHRTGAGALLAEFQYGHDRDSHRLFEKRVHDANQGDVYRYDSAYRVTRNSRGIDLTAVAAGSEIDPDTYASTPSRLEYAFDGVQNRTTSTDIMAGTPTVTTYTQTPDGALKDAEVNQYTSTQQGVLPPRSYTYDNNGNLTSDGSRTYAYDFKNRLVEVRDQATTALVAQYSYDALDRRVLKTTPAATVRFLFDDDQVVEERDGANAVTRQYVWGSELDNLLQEKTAAATWYAHENAVGSITALSNPSGTVVERYRYDPFGNTTLALDGATGNPIRFHAAYADAETGLLLMRHRSYSPALGRFLQRDPLGVWTDEANLGNPLAFVGNDPISKTDPMGMSSTVGGQQDPQPYMESQLDELRRQVDEQNKKIEELEKRFEKAQDDAERKRLEDEARELQEQQREIKNQLGSVILMLGLALEEIPRFAGFGKMLVGAGVYLETNMPTMPGAEHSCVMGATGSGGGGCGASAAGGGGGLLGWLKSFFE